MKLTNIPMRRIREVVIVFYDLKFGTWIGNLHLSMLIPLHKLWMKISQRNTHLSCPLEERKKHAYQARADDLPKNFRIALERLGGTYVKLGQLLSLREDIVTKPVADELRKLQDQNPSFPASTARSILERELKKPVKSLFKTFEDKPIGSGSLAQVHVATLHNGKKVAVKILRPGIRSIFQEDILILKWVARLLENHLPKSRPFQPRKTIDEFEAWTQQELNLINEAVNIEHFRKLFADDEDIHIPGVLWNYTTSDVLTMEFSHGVRVDAFEEYRKRQSSRSKVASVGMRLAFRQFFEYGFFHGDPHPGNFFIIKDNILCLHDFGIVGRIDDHTRRELIGCLVNFLEKDADNAIKHLLHMATTNDDSDIGGFTREVWTIMERWFYGPTKGERLSVAFYNVLTAGMRHSVYFSSHLILLAKAIVTMESMGLMLNPKFDMGQELKPYLGTLMMVDLKPQSIVKQVKEVFLDSVNILDDLPEAAKGILKLSQQKEFGVSLNAREFRTIKREIDRQSDIRFLNLILVATLIGTAVMFHLEGVQKVAGINVSTIGLIVAGVLAVVLLVKIRSKAK